jgi:hypothetical protein
MPGALLPVKRPETLQNYPAQAEEPCSVGLQENKRQKSAAGFLKQTKKYDCIPTSTGIFAQLQIQDLIVDVLYERNVRIGDAVGKRFLKQRCTTRFTATESAMGPGVAKLVVWFDVWKKRVGDILK